MHPDKAPLSGVMPVANSVWPRVLLTDGETPLRLTVRGAHLARAVPADRGGAAAAAAGPESVREAAWSRASAAVQAANSSGNAAAAVATATAAVGVVTCDCDLQAELREPKPQSVAVIARCRCDDQLTLRTSCVPGEPPDSAVHVDIRPPTLQGGAGEVVWIEVWSGTYLSPAIPVLVTPDVELACSVESLMARFQRFCSAGDQVRPSPGPGPPHAPRVTLRRRQRRAALPVTCYLMVRVPRALCAVLLAAKMHGGVRLMPLRAARGCAAGEVCPSPTTHPTRPCRPHLCIQQCGGPPGALAMTPTYRGWLQTRARAPRRPRVFPGCPPGVCVAAGVPREPPGLAGLPDALSMQSCPPLRVIAFPRLPRTCVVVYETHPGA